MPFVQNNRFYNSSDDSPENIFIHTIPSFIQSLIGQKKRFPRDVHTWCVTEPIVQQSDALKVTWIGHSTFLIQIGGLNILTDPIFGHPSFLFPRMLPAGIAIDQLPAIDLILISHNHQDHLDLPSLETFNNIPILVPQGDKDWLTKRGFYKVEEFMWWDTARYQGVVQGVAYDIEIDFLPAVHWSARGLFDRNKSLWGSWLVRCNGQSVYFAGDTAYGEHFSIIGQEFPSISVALMPIAPCKPNPAMLKSHMDVAQSIDAFNDLGAQVFVPMHWGTFAFGVDYFEEPIIELRQLWQTHMMNHKELCILRAGQSTLIPRIDIPITVVPEKSIQP